MTWQSIRLELDRTREFPKGSAGRAYLLRLPLDAEGAIDEAAMRVAPERATMRRFWPNEPDRRGHVRRSGDHWALVSDAAERNASVISEIAPGAIREGALVEVRERGGETLPFRVAKCAPCRRGGKLATGLESMAELDIAPSPAPALPRASSRARDRRRTPSGGPR